MQAYIVNPTAFYQDAKWRTDARPDVGYVHVLPPRKDLLWTTHAGRGLHIVHLPLCRFHYYDHHENNFELLSMGFWHKEGADTVVNVMCFDVPQWNGVKHGTVHVFCGDSKDVIGVYDFLKDRAVPGGIELRISSGHQCDNSTLWLPLHLFLADFTLYQEMDVEADVSHEVYKVLFLKPAADQGACNDLSSWVPPSGRQSASEGWSEADIDTSHNLSRHVESSKYRWDEASRAPHGWPLGRKIGEEPISSLPCDTGGEYHVHGGSCMTMELSLASFSLGNVAELLSSLGPGVQKS